jgi:hypothetical protein
VDRVCRSEQKPAALPGRGEPRVRVDLVEHRLPDADGYCASTAMAMPMPPPMHSDATP